MGCATVFENYLAKYFISTGRNRCLRLFIKNPDIFNLFNGSCEVSPMTDIFLPRTYFTDENEEVPGYSTFRTPINFRNGLLRGSESEDSDFLVGNLRSDNISDPARYSMEHFDIINYDHHKEINMDRIVDNGTKSFVPLDIGKSYMNEVACYYETLFGHLPNEYYGIDFSDKAIELNFEKTMKNVEKNFGSKVKHRFVYRSSSINPLKNKNWKNIKILEVNYVLEGGILLYLSKPFNAVITVYDNPGQLDSIISTISTKKIRKIPEKPRFKLLVHIVTRRDAPAFKKTLEKPFSSFLGRKTFPSRQPM